MIVFRQMFDASSSTYSYLLADPETRDCVLIDPVFEQVRRDAAFIRELQLDLAEEILRSESRLLADRMLADERREEYAGRDRDCERGCDEVAATCA